MAFWRDDFADQNLGMMMNSLAIEQNGVLVDQRVLEKGGYNIGDAISPVVSMYGNSFEIDFKIAFFRDLERIVENLFMAGEQRFHLVIIFVKQGM